MSLPSFTITGTLFDLLGNTDDAGEIIGNGLGGSTPATVTFTSNVPIDRFVHWSGDGSLERVREVVGVVNSDGTITRNGEPVKLLANDAGLSVEGVQWQAHATGMSRFWFNAPSDGGTVNLGTVAPVPGLGVSGVTFSEGELVTLLSNSGSSIRAALDALYGPGLVDEYHPYTNLAAFPATGVTDRLYLAMDTGKLYRWTGSVYLQIADKAAVGLGNVDNTSDVNKPVSTAQASAISAAQAAAIAASQPLDSDLTAFAAKTAPTGAVVGTTDAQTLTSKTLTDPKVNRINDANGNRVFDTPAAANAVNYFEFDNTAAGITPTIYAWGSDTDIDLNLDTKGAGVVKAKSIPVVTTTGTQTLTNKTLTNPTITNYTESVVAIGNTSTAKTISLTSGTMQTATLTGNCTFTMPTAAAGKSFQLALATGAGGFTATFTGVKWAAGTAPTVTVAASKTDVFTFSCFDGSNWIGSVMQAVA